MTMYNQFELGKFEDLLLSQEDLEMGFPLLVMENSKRVYPNNQLLYLKEIKVV